ncbi:MAG: AmmeMemoRadiSam system protein B [Planctomycetota bacterium]
MKKTIVQSLLLGFFLAVAAPLAWGEESAQEARPPAVAGAFYPGDRLSLDRDVRRYLADASPPAVPGEVKILIAPHAGYVYSAKTAAHAFRLLQERKDVTTVILMGSPHRAAVRDVAVWTGGPFRTPLGDMPIDLALAREISRETGGVADPEAHRGEQSLEVEVPFLQVVAPGAKIVPILVQLHSSEAAGKLAAALVRALEKEGVVLVVSTDLVHYPTSETLARAIDKKTLDGILALDPQKFLDTSRHELAQNHPGVRCTACAEDAVYVSLLAARRLGLTGARVLYYANSAAQSDAPGGPIVGYGAVAIFKKSPGKEGEEMVEPESEGARFDPGARGELLAIARASVEAALKGLPYEPSRPERAALLERGGCFVTLKNQGRLRGCLGRFEADLPLYQAVSRMARASATEDSRFRYDPVRLSELPRLSIEISALSPRRRVSSWKEVRLGRDGVVVRRGFRSGVFLPQVATETGWGLEEFLDHLCRDKAGLEPDAYKDPETVIEVFDAEVFGAEPEPNEPNTDRPENP